MPGGGGSAGGGGGGGGGFGGGGGYYGGYGGRGGGGNPFGFIIFLIIATPIAVILAVGLGLGLGTEPHQIRSTETYALSDNRIINYKGDFCQDLRTSSTSVPMNRQSTGYLYFLRDRPPLTESERFNASVTAELNSNFNFRFWNFYLNTGSEALFKVCYQYQGLGSRNVVFYIIRGIDNLNEWKEEPSDREAEKTYRLTSECETINYEVPRDGMYYFVFYLSSGSSVAVDVYFDIDRLLYNVQPDNIIHECLFALDGSSSCVLSAGMNTPYTAVLSLNASRPIEYAEDGAEIRIHCQPRGWLYAVIVLSIFVFAPLIVICGIVGCVVVVLKSKKKRTSATSQSTAVASTTIESSFTKPSYPTQSTYPSQPAYPTQPAYPSEPAYPSKPAPYPSQPGAPYPSEPAYPPPPPYS